MSNWTNERDKTMKRLIPALVTLIIINCASYSQIMINAQGEMHRCGAYGNGLVGIIQANKIQDDCVSSMRTAGYVEIEKAGAIGVYFTESDTLASILKVIPESPAAFAGIQNGDIILSVDDTKVNTSGEARILIFGLAGTSVMLTLKRYNEILSVNLTRRPYTALFGIPTVSK